MISHKYDRVVACVVAALGFVLLFVLLALLKNPIMVEYYLYKLRCSSELKGQEKAGEELIALNATSKIPILFELTSRSYSRDQAAFSDIVRYHVLSRLLLLSGQGAMPYLTKALQDDDPAIRRLSLYQLDTLLYRRVLSVHVNGTNRQVIVAALISLLSDSDVRTRRVAAGLLGKMGPEAREARMVLLEATRDEDEAMRLSAEDALEQIEKSLSETGGKTP